MAPNQDALRRLQALGFSTATDLADWLVREAGYAVPRCAPRHRRTGGAGRNKGCDLPDLTLADMQGVHADITDAVFGVLSVENSVASRTSYGGTAPVRVGEQIAAWRERLATSG